MTGYLEKRHLLTAQQSEQLIAWGVQHLLIWAPGVLAVVWGIWKSWWSRKKLMVALPSTEPMTENDAKAIIRSGAVTPTVSTPKHTVPGVPIT